MWLVHLIKKAFPQRFRVARLTHLPIIGGLIDKALFEGDDLVYLPSDRSIKIQENIAQPESIVLPSQVVEHFIRKASHRWIMNFCLCREGNQCQDYPRQYGCIFLGPAVIQINPELGRLATEEEAIEHARQCRETGLVHMIGDNKLDSMWLGAWPREHLMTICNCCPCCCLFTTLPVLNDKIRSKIKRMPGVSVEVNDFCIGCGTCSEEGVCFADAIHLVNEQAEIGPECRGCGRCVDICPNEAIEVHIDNNGYVENLIHRLAERVQVE